MNTRRLSLAPACPTNSASVLGRSAASASSAWREEVRTGLSVMASAHAAKWRPKQVQGDKSSGRKGHSSPRRPLERHPDEVVESGPVAQFPRRLCHGGGGDGRLEAQVLQGRDRIDAGRARRRRNCADTRRAWQSARLVLQPVNEIGHASCRDEVCTYVEITVV